MVRAHMPHRAWLGADIGALAVSFGAIGILTAIYAGWIGVTNATIVALSFLLIVLIVATVSTRRVAIATSLLAFLCFNYFFLPPVGTWTIADPQNWVELFTLLAVSIVASHLSSQVRRRAQEATARRDELARLFDLTRDILLTTDAADPIALLARNVSHRFALEAVAICLPAPGGGWELHHAGERPLMVDSPRLDTALAAAQAPLEFEANDRTDAGHGRIESSNDGTAWLVPLRVGVRAIGLLALKGDGIEPDTRDAIAGVTAIAIERTHLLEEREEAELVRRGAELKSALLASLGHDLKTPLTAVTVAANNLDASWLTNEQRREQVGIVRAELARLNRLFEDIVDMARIEANAVDADLEWVEPAEIAEAAVRQVGPALEAHQLSVHNGAERALVRLDPRLTSAALAHLVENAAQYSPAGSTITVSIALADHELNIAVRDQGAGVAPQDLDRVFERFYRGVDARRQRFGTGMGLAITRGLLVAERGQVRAENDPRGGAVFTIAVPVETRTTAGLEDESP